MARTTEKFRGRRLHRVRLAALAVGLTATGLGLGGCGAISKLHHILHQVRSNKSTIDAFTATIQSSEAVTFEATYTTSGSSPATVVYAVHPPTGLAFIDTPSTSAASGGGNFTGFRIVVNPAGEFACSPPSTGAKWSCTKLPKANAATENEIFDFYTPDHWVTFLRDFSLAAGFAGDAVTSSLMTVNGFAMHCVDFRAPGVPGTSTICTTAQGILGYVKVAGDSTSFEIRSYSSSPPASLFQLPPGATVTTIPQVTSTTS